MWEVRVDPEVRPLPTKGGGGRPFAYRLSGALHDRVCGLHLKRGYRLAFTMREANSEEHEGVVEIIYAGKRDTRDRAKDAWTIVHHICGKENPPSGRLRPPCCQGGPPDMDEEELGELMDRLRRLRRALGVVLRSLRRAQLTQVRSEVTWILGLRRRRTHFLVL